MPNDKIDNILKDVKNKNIDPVALDSDLQTASKIAKEKLATPTDNAALLKAKLDKLTPKGNTSAQSTNPVEERDPFTPDIRVTQNKAGFGTRGGVDPLNPDVQVTPPQSSAQQNTASDTRQVRTATQIDLAKLTEADILNIPEIDAKSFDVPAMLQLQPKDPTIRFRWVNYKNYEGGNYAMFKAIGFSNATPIDVQGEMSEHLLKEDGTIKWFDVILMKVNVFLLMGVYKKNIIRSLEQVGRWQRAAIAQARRTIENEVGSDIWQQLKKEEKTVEFYAPSVKEMADQDASYGG